jgi:hypothetical protein
MSQSSSALLIVAGLLLTAYFILEQRLGAPLTRLARTSQEVLRGHQLICVKNPSAFFRLFCAPRSGPAALLIVPAGRISPLGPWSIGHLVRQADCDFRGDAR